MPLGSTNRMRVNRTALTEIMFEEIVEFIEQLFAEEFLERFASGVNGFEQAREDTLLKIACFYFHQVDVTRIAFDFGVDEDVFEGVEELLFVAGGGGHG